MKLTLVESKDKTKVSIGSITLYNPIETTTCIWQNMSELFSENGDTSRPTSDEYWKGILDDIFDIIFKIYPESTTYYLNAETEILWIQFFRDKGIISYLENKFKNKKLIFRDGNVHPIKDIIPFEWDSECVFWGGSSDLSNEFTSDRKFSKHFTCLQGRWTKSREDIYHHLYDNNLLYKTFYTFASQNPKELFHSMLDDGTNYHYTPEEGEHDTIHGKSVMFYPNHWYKQSFCNIILESSFYSNDLPMTVFNKIFFTEKTEKCFTAMQPFILVGNRHGLKYLKELGFKTFDKWWDESYDDEHTKHRLRKISKIISEISRWSLRDCEEVYKEMIPILKHNQDLNIKLSESNYLFYTTPINQVTLIKNDSTINIIRENAEFGEFENTYEKYD